MDLLLFAILAAVFGLLKWLASKAEQSNADAEAEQGPPQSGVPNPPVQRRKAETEEERVRRFLEALGVPTSSMPPPKVEPKPVDPKRVFVPQTPPIPQAFPAPTWRPTAQTPSPSQPQWIPEPRSEPATKPTWERPLVVAPVEISPPVEVKKIKVPIARTSVSSTETADPEDVWDLPAGASEPSSSSSRRTGKATQSSLVARLANAQGLRDAIVLREIFGPPRSMQSLQELRF